MSMQNLAKRIKERAKELGFDLCGIAPATPSSFKPEFLEWLDKGMHGEMGYMARNPERRLDPALVMPDAKSIVVVAMNYYNESDADTCDPDRAIFARYARGDDYHDVMGKRLRELLGFIKSEAPWVRTTEDEDEDDSGIGCEGSRRLAKTLMAQALSERGICEGSRRLSNIGGEGGSPQKLQIANCKLQIDAAVHEGSRTLTNEGGEGAVPTEGLSPQKLQITNYKLQIDAGERGVPTEGRVYVDTGPILEREVAQRAGIGWFGKNTMLINTRRGSYFLLGEILLNLPLPPDEPAIGGCGTCTKCIDACPTQAIVAPFKLDARRCISYLTIELKGPIPEDLAPKMGNRIFGCDICQEVCPICIKQARPTDVPDFQPSAATTAPKLIDLLTMTEEEFRQGFKGSPVKRTKWRGLLRNVAAALSASDDPAAESALAKALDHPEELVREQAELSLGFMRQRRMEFDPTTL